MIECKDLTGKVIRLCSIFEDGSYGPEIHMEFTDGTTFSACLETSVRLEAKYTKNEGGEPQLLNDYSIPAVPR